MKISITIEPGGAAIWCLDSKVELLQFITSGDAQSAKMWVRDTFGVDLTDRIFTEHTTR